jgi:hypothetical protein
VIQSKITSLYHGDDLWVADLNLKSPITQKLDFYLNYRLSNFLFQEEPSLNSDQLAVVQKIGLSATDKLSKFEDPYLVKSDDILGPHWTLFVPFEAPNWKVTLFKTWQGLQKPKTRIFVPPYLDWKILLQDWPEDPRPQLYQDIL